MKIRSFVIGLAALAAGSPSMAAPSAGGADVTVNINAPAGQYVYTPGEYRVDVSNIGNKNADAVMLTITLPRTGTSPQVYVLGELGAFDPRCSRVGTNLSCSLGTVRRGATTAVRFTIEWPESTSPLVVGAAVSTQTAERSGTNNNDADTAFLLHPLTHVNVGEQARVDHCTGTGLVSFFECTLFPSSISFHEIEFQAGGMVAFINPPASGYWGTYDQGSGDDYLVLDYYELADHAAHFEGRAVGGRCFEGVTEFFPASAYVAPYRVCLP